MSLADELARRQHAAAVKATEVFADHILGKAQRIAPHDEGTLGASGTRDTTETSAGVEVRISFATVYAARQHEELTWRHKPGKQAKYLEGPFKEAVPGFAPFVARAVAAVT